MITFEQMQQLITIEQEGTLSKSSEKLFISQPALSRSMQRLEQSLGVQLFEHKKNKLILNDAGLLAVKLSKELLEKRAQMISLLQQTKKYHIGSIAIMPIRKYQYLENIEFTLCNSHQQLIDALYNEKYDAIISIEKIKDEDYINIKLFEENLYILLTKDHPKSHLKELSFKDLDGISILKYRNVGFWDKITTQHMINPKIIYQENEKILDELRMQSNLPYFRTNQSRNEKIDQNRIAIPIKDSSAHVTYYAITKKDNKILSNLLKKHDDLK